jgi:hypothetical protein
MFSDQTKTVDQLVKDDESTTGRDIAEGAIIGAIGGGIVGGLAGGPIGLVVGAAVAAAASAAAVDAVDTQNGQRGPSETVIVDDINRTPKPHNSDIRTGRDAYERAADHAPYSTDVSSGSGDLGYGLDQRAGLARELESTTVSDDQLNEGNDVGAPDATSDRSLNDNIVVRSVPLE